MFSIPDNEDKRRLNLCDGECLAVIHSKMWGIFSFSKDGIIKTNDNYLNRINKLKECIDFHLSTAPEKEITIEYLFFN